MIWTLFLLTVVVSGRTECSSFVTLSECTTITLCFWRSTHGVCENLDDWSKQAVGPTANVCESKENLNTCYGHVSCFWVATAGVCELITEWVPNTPTARSPGCGGILEETECWNNEACFWNRHGGRCDSLNPGDAQTVAPSLMVVATSEEAAPMPVPEETLTTLTPVPAETEPAVINTFPPSTNPTAFWEPMNLCETFDASDCAFNFEDCSWDKATKKCLARDGDCASLYTEDLCMLNEECSWSGTACQSMCDTIDSEASCAYTEDCFWEADAEACFPKMAACDRLETPSYCAQNEACYWNVKDAECLSFFGTCSRMETDDQCSMSETCVWSEDTLECLDRAVAEAEGTGEAGAVQLTCEDFDVEKTCAAHNSTEDGGCVWDQKQVKCVEFKFDCEDFDTEATCNGASWGNMVCYWKGECDEKKEVLQRVHLTLPKDPLPEHAPNMYILLLVFFGCCIVGLICTMGLYCMFFTSKIEEEMLLEPLDLETYAEYNPHYHYTDPYTSGWGNVDRQA